MSQQQVFSDRYEMVRHIARGGMAQVYLARDLLLDRPVALKVLFPELSVDRAFVERFRREAKAAANLSHPNIVSIYDWGQGERTYFIVMEYVEGSTLSALMRQGPLEPEQAAGIGAEVAAALEFAHKRGVIHRDVKPGNVLIENGTGRAKVADFGIARAIGTSEDLTQTGSVMGTATYFSPEQAQGMPVDARSDVYSLGVVLYEMAAGRAPFAGDSPVSIVYKHVKENPPLPSELNPAVPEPFEAIIMKALAKSPEDRYETAEALRADLVRFSAGEEVAAEPTRVAPALAAAAADATATVALGADRTRVMGGRRDATMTMPPGGGVPAEPVGGGEPRPGRAALIAALVVLLLVALGLGGFFGGKQLGLWDSAKTVTIPPVANKPAATAMSVLKLAGLTNVTTQNQQSGTVKKGYAVGTNPVGGTKEKTSDRVVLIVSSGPGTVTISSAVVGEPASQAESTLQGEGLKTTTTNQPSSTVQTGFVISTNPPTGSAVAPGSSVELIVSSGKQQETIPPLVGESPTTAGSILSSLGLVPSQQSEPSASVPSGEVTRTDPPANSQVPSGTTVVVFVSTGAPQVPMPNLVGDTEAQAQNALSSAGLVGQFNPPNAPSNSVVTSQNIPPGTKVDKGSTVVVQVQSTPTTSTPGPTTTLPGATTTFPGPPIS